MNNILHWYFILFITLYPTLNFSMQSENNVVNICNCSPDTLSKCFYVGAYGIGLSCLAVYGGIKIADIAQQHNHTDPVSEGYAAFMVTEGIGSAIGAYGYKFCFETNNKPVIQHMKKDGPSNTFLKHQALTPHQKACKKEIKRTNRRRDTIKKIHNKIKRD